MFANPKARRLHLIAAHAYPKEYFFSVTNKGIGGLLRRWGDGASLLRGPWRPRNTERNAEGNGNEESTSPARKSSSHQHSDSDGEGGENFTEGETSFEPDSAFAPSMAEQEATMECDADRDALADPEVDALACSVSSLGLVPSSVRFGRGGPTPRGRAGLATPSGRPAARHIGHPLDANHHRTAVDNKGKDKDVDGNMEVGEPSAMEQEAVAVSDKTSPVRGWRGRGRVSGDGRGGGAGVGRGMGRTRGFVPPPPRGGFLSRGAAGRGFSRGLITANMRQRGRGAGV